MGKKSGFTLIELLIVVVIIGILASIAIPKFNASREKSFLSTMKSDLKNLATYQEIHHNGSFTYSTSISTLEMVPELRSDHHDQRGDWCGLGCDRGPRGHQLRTLRHVSG